MKKRNLILQAAVASALLATFGTAQAGTVTASSINYASEAVGAATALTLGNVVYSLGVARTTTQPFTVIYTLTGTSNPVFNATPAVPTAAGGTCAIAGSSLKRGGANTNQVVYDIVVSANCAAADTLTLVAPVIKSATATAGITVQLLDTGETACVDNAGTTSTCIIASTPRASLVAASGFGAPAALAAPTADTGSVIDVNATVPLAGFVVQTTAVANDKDTAAAAKAALAVTNTVTNVKNAGNTADFTLAAGDLVTLTLTDVTGFLGLATNGACFDVDASAVLNGTTTPCAIGEIFTVSGNTATLASIPGNSTGFNGVGQTVTYTSDATTQMGTTRTIGVDGSVTPTASGGSTHAFTGNSSFWQWTSNGTILQAPLMQTTSGYISRFALTNTGTSPATYTAVVRSETGNTCTLGAGASGTIPASGQLVVDASSLCTGWTTGQAPRGAAIFTINAPTGNIQGVNQIVNATTGSVSNYVMVRPASN